MKQSLSRAEDAVGRVSLWRGKDIKMSPLSGGLTNENYLVEADGKRYVMRIPGASTELLSIDRLNEVHNARAAASTGIGQIGRASCRERGEVSGGAVALASKGQR